MYFALFPPIQIDGESERTVNINGLESIQKVSVSPKKVSVVLKINEKNQTYDVIRFNDPFPYVHSRLEPDDDFPLELMALVTIEFFEEIAKLIEGYTVISSEPPPSGYFEFFRGDRYPISIRGADKQIYATTAELRSLRKDYVVSLKSLLQIDFEEQLGNALATFVDNVLLPMSATMNQVFNLDKELEAEESIVNIIGGDFKRLITRTEELISIVNYNMEQTAERNKAFLRLTLPLMLKQALLENFEEYLHIESEINTLKLSVKNHKQIPAEKIAELITKTFR